MKHLVRCLLPAAKGTRAALLLVFASWAPAAFGQTPTFAPVVNYDTGTNSGPAAVVAADLNGDGQLDLLTANFYSSTVGVLLGTGTGRFGGTALYSTGAGSFPLSLAVADVNGDGHPDVLTANTLTNTVGVLLGTGTGTFANPMAYSTGATSNPNCLTVADVNGDGYPDVLTANTGSNTVGVLLGTSAGGFGAVATYATGPAYQPVSLAVADVNGDGHPDVLTANSMADAVGVLLGTGHGSFGAATPYALGLNSRPFAVAVADVNGDGQLDLLTANSGTGTAGVLLGTGTGSFGPVRTFSTGPASQPLGLAVADMNGDGHLDLLAATDSSPTVCLLLGTGTGSFGAVTTYSAGPNSYPHGLTAADVNGDGKLDVLTANGGNNTAGVLLSTAPVLATHAACQGVAQAFTLPLGYTADSVRWDFGDPASGVANQSLRANPTHVYATPGLYTVALTLYFPDGGRQVLRTRQQVVANPVVDLGPDFDLCPGTVRRLMVPETAGATYRWQDGSTSAAFTVRTPGRYWVTGTTAAGCQRSDTIRIGADPAVQVRLGADTVVCVGEVLHLQPRSSGPGLHLRWQDGSTQQTLTVRTSGTYWVEATNAEGCSQRDSVRIVYLTPPVLHLGGDTAVCSGSGPPLVLDVTLPGVRYRWQDGSTGSTFRPTRTGTYSVTVSTPFCSVSDSIRVRLYDCPLVGILVPNIITPNGDGRNDQLTIIGLGTEPWALTIFNRWGRCVYATSRYGQDWTAQELPDGMYYYLLQRPAAPQVKGWLEVRR
jgi:gliding motility-associated-like protein